MGGVFSNQLNECRLLKNYVSGVIHNIQCNKRQWAGGPMNYKNCVILIISVTETTYFISKHNQPQDLIRRSLSQYRG
jgi:hypothetical protein